MEYNFREIEKKWQKYWDDNQTFKTSEDLSNPKKYYILDMFPYPSGTGLHVGHPEGYTATDIIARYKRMQGFNVLRPMGWDAFGLPAEQYAIQTGTHPAITTKTNCNTFRRQIKELGLSYDWEKEINTTDPRYFKWTQWIFTLLYDTWFDNDASKGKPISELKIPSYLNELGIEERQKYINSKRLAYYDNAHVWWCKQCKIVCANEEVLTDGTHEKCGNQVNRKNLKQWMLRIPHYAERLLSGLKNLDWPEGVKDMQINWIGKSTGAEVDFKVEGTDISLSVFTTRPDTLFGATYMVIAPEHNYTLDIATEEKLKKVKDYIKSSALKSDLDRTDLAKTKTGVFTGRYAINPVNNKQIPIWIADYVLTGYGTGAIMAVPAHDSRDFEFAAKFGLDIDCIMAPATTDTELRDDVLKGKKCWTKDGKYINSSNSKTGLNINGLPKEKGIAKTIEWLEAKKLGKSTINYKLRDWLFSRQRYWGEPFPVIHWEDGDLTVLKENELALELPSMEKYEPSVNGESPLANAKQWLSVIDKDGRKGRRETNTMPQWAGSCWYYLRYIDPLNEQNIFDKKKEKYWMPVDLYIGGAEHAVLHLLYSRFWHKVLFDLGIVSTDEPFKKLFNQGMILAFAYETKTGAKVSSDFVKERDGKYYHSETDEELTQIVAKMSKSLKNVINPDEIVSKFGADSLRLYEMFIGPLDATKPWDEKGVKGVFGFLARVYRFFANVDNIFKGNENVEITKALHQAIKKVETDIESLKFNTAISALMIFTNTATKKGRVSIDTASKFALLLAPFAPHLSEELWQLYGSANTLAYEPWPILDMEVLQEETYEYPVSFNGKLRFKIKLSVSLTTLEIEKIVLADDRATKWIGETGAKKVIVVPNRIVNIVV